MHLSTLPDIFVLFCKGYYLLFVFKSLHAPVYSHWNFPECKKNKIELESLIVYTKTSVSKFLPVRPVSPSLAPLSGSVFLTNRVNIKAINDISRKYSWYSEKVWNWDACPQSKSSSLMGSLVCKDPSSCLQQSMIKFSK